MTATRLIQITDLHLGSSDQEQLAGVFTYDSMQAVFHQLDANGDGNQPLLLTGDLAGHAEEGAYRLLNQYLLSRQQDAYWLPGNHDDVLVMARGLSDFPRHRAVEMGNWVTLLLDSSQPDTPAGHLTDAELRFTEHMLQKYADKFVLVAMHHTPVTTGSRWLDTQQIDNQERLHSLLIKHGNVKAVVTGHVHQSYDGDWDGIPLFSTPSSCVQFEANSDDFALADLPPAYRWIDLFDNGRLETGVEEVTNFAQQADKSCVGY